MWYGNITKDLEDLGNSVIKSDKIALIDNRIEEYQEESIQRNLKEKLDAIRYDKSGLDKLSIIGRGRTDLKHKVTEEENGYGFDQV